jgi:uncharacterized protein YwgA
MARALNRQEMMLAAMSSAGCGSFQPVHVQKLFFLIDEKLGSQMGGKYFDFEPYDYGPFDKAVYAELEGLSSDGLVSVAGGGRYREYALTNAGLERGEAALAGLGDPVVAHGLATLTAFVRSLGFAELVSSVYRAYPAMKANSVFSER